MERRPMAPNKVRAMTLTRLFGGVIAIAAMFFLTAGTFDYWQAWAYLLVLFLPLFFWATYLIARNPALLERRLRSREAEPEQRRIIAVSTVVLLTAFILPALDRRYAGPRSPPGSCSRQTSLSS